MQQSESARVTFVRMKKSITSVSVLAISPKRTQLASIKLRVSPSKHDITRLDVGFAEPQTGISILLSLLLLQNFTGSDIAPLMFAPRALVVPGDGVFDS